MLYSNKKGQIFSLDAIIACLVFVGILVAAFMIWDTIYEKTITIQNSHDIDVASRNAIHSLFNYEGIPTNWSDIGDSDFSSTTVNSLGISSISGGELELNKIQKLVDVNDTKYDDLVILLGLMGYDFQLNFYYWNVTEFTEEYKIGEAVPLDTEQKVVRSRMVMLNGTRTKGELILWQI